MKKGKSKELDRALGTITRALMSEGSGRVQDGVLRAALRELKAVAKGGRRISRKRLVRIIGVIAEIACDKFLKHDARR
jgi:hypothetical protein